MVIKPTTEHVRNAYDGRQQFWSDVTALNDFDKSLTQQNMADDCDINIIMSRFATTGQLPPNSSVPQYGDFSGISDFHSAMNTVIAAQDAFMSLDARLRARFGNDPGAYVEFLLDPSNKDEAIKLGLATATSSTGDSQRATHAGEESPVGDAPRKGENASKGTQNAGD